MDPNMPERVETLMLVRYNNNIRACNTPTFAFETSIYCAPYSVHDVHTHTIRYTVTTKFRYDFISLVAAPHRAPWWRVKKYQKYSLSTTIADS
jgi:hypothetical protein